jgi:hypothetical protein
MSARIFVLPTNPAELSHVFARALEHAKDYGYGRFAAKQIAGRVRSHYRREVEAGVMRRDAEAAALAKYLKPMAASATDPGDAA